VYQMGPTWATVATWFCGFIPFAFATWEEYFTGKLTLGILNGPTDGVLICIGFCVMEAVWPGFWPSPLGSTIGRYVILPASIRSVPAHFVILAIGYVGLVPTLGYNCWAVFFRSDRVKTTGYLYPLKYLVPFVVEGICLIVWFSCSPTNVFVAHPRIFLFGFGFLFANLVMNLMLAHLTNEGYQSLRLSLVPVMICTACAVGRLLPISEFNLLVIFCCSSVAIWLYFVLNVITELCALLNLSWYRIDYSTALRATSPTPSSPTLIDGTCNNNVDKTH